MPQPPRTRDRLFHDVLLPAETLAVRAQARQFADDVLAPMAGELNTLDETREAFPHTLFKAIAAAGLYRIPFGTDVGGAGLQYPMLATATVIEELGYYSPGAASALYDGQAILVGATLDRAPAPIRDEYLPRLVRGEVIGSFATTEPQASTDLSPKMMATVAVPAAGGWRVTGRKRFITNAVAAEFVLLLCRTADYKPLMLLADLTGAGVRVGDPDRKLGNRAQLTADIYFDDLFVPDDRVIAQPGAGLGAALGSLALGRIGIGAIGVAMAQAAFDHAVAHLGTREVFGKRLGEFQHWQFTFADHALGLESARSLYQKAALRMDQGAVPPEPEAAMAKIAGSRLAVDVARDAIQVMGGYGFLRELAADGQVFPLESIYRDAKIGEIYEGANEIQKWIIARQIFGRDITG